MDAIAVEGLRKRYGKVEALAGVRHFLSGVFFSRGLTARDPRILGYVAPLTENPNDLALFFWLLVLGLEFAGLDYRRVRRRLHREAQVEADV